MCDMRVVEEDAVFGVFCRRFGGRGIYIVAHCVELLHGREKGTRPTCLFLFPPPQLDL